MNDPRQADARHAILSRIRGALGREDPATTTGTGFSQGFPPRNPTARRLPGPKGSGGFTGLFHETPAHGAFARETLDLQTAFAPAPVRPVIVEKDLSARFAAKLTAVAGEVARVADLAAAPAAVIEHLDRHGLPHRLLASGDGIVKDIPWPGEITLRHGAATDEDRVSITGALAAVAETGSLVLCSSEQTPTTLSFLPEDHMVVLGVEQIVPYMEDAWEAIRAAFPNWPRAVNFITGPSRTGDIEQTMQLGAHGPRRLLVILVGARGKEDGSWL